MYRCGEGKVQQFAEDAEAGTLCAANGGCLAARSAFEPRPAAIAGVQWWAKPLGAGRAAALFLNGGPLPYRANLSVVHELNLSVPAGGSVAATDVWSGADAGPVVGADGVFDTGTVASLDSRFVIFEARAAAPEGGAEVVEAAADLF